MNQMNLPPSFVNAKPAPVTDRTHSFIGQQRKTESSGHSYAIHTKSTRNEGKIQPAQIQAEQKTEQVRKDWSASTVWESVSDAIDKVVTAFLFIPKTIWKGINQVKLAVSDQFKTKEVRDVQSLLNDEKIQHSNVDTDGFLKYKEKWGNEKEFTMPHQFSRDLLGCRYYFNNEDLAEKSFQDLKDKKQIQEKDVAEGLHPGSNSTVRFNAGLMLEKQFGRQGMLNIASLLNQASTPKIQQHIQDLGADHYGRETGSKNATSSSFPEFHLQDQGDHVKMSIIIYLAVYPKDELGMLNPEADPSYVIGKREITLSKEDLQQDWTKQTWGIAPSLKVNDSYSGFHKTLDAAKQEMGLNPTPQP